MQEWCAIRYRDFCDVPRMFVVEYLGEWYLFDCRFDEASDEYSKVYSVHLLRKVSETDLAGSWEDLKERIGLKYLGDVAVKEVQFDPTRRKGVSRSALERALRR